LALTETQRGELIEDLQQNVDFEYQSWNPSLQVWRAGEGHERILPYVTVDFISTSGKLFPSMADIVGRIDDRRYEHAYCELEQVSITVYANKMHNSDTIRGRDYADIVAKRIRNRILAYWKFKLADYNASIDRAFDMPIRDLSMAHMDVTTRVHEYEFSVYLRTDVRWYKDLEQGQEAEEKADKAFIELENVDDNIKNNLRVIFNG